MTMLIALAALQMAAPAAAAAAPDYRSDAAWLCRPGRTDACAADQDVTVIEADGRRRVERFRPAANPSFDCFYVYPTVSLNPTPNSDMTAGDEERRVATLQAARFRAQCRVFAPLYRQVTLTALRAVMTGGANTADRAMALADVTAAWRDYLARDNKGRGVVLIGHSQGSGVLKALIAAEIEGKPAASRMIAAYLAGTNVAVPAGQDVGGDLKQTPLCRSDTQTGCVVAWVSFRADQPPPAGSRFGATATPGQAIACVNPAAPGGGSAPADTILPSRDVGIASVPMAPWTKDGAAVATPFVRVPGLISAQCVAQNGFSYLAATTNADPADPRTDTISGDVVANGQVLRDWGLHLVDMPLVMGDLVSLSAKQAAAWRADAGRRPAK